MSPIKLCIMLVSVLLTACTTGQLYYIDNQGDQKLACEVEFVGMPSVDKYAVEYALSLCAKSAVRKGYKIKETYLLEINTAIIKAPCGNIWSHELARQKYDKGKLSTKEYGYIVAHIDLGLAVLNECSP